MPQGHDALNVACLPFHHFAVVSSPYGNRTRITRMRVSYPEPLEERAVLSVTRTGIEPALARLKASLQNHHRTAPW